MITFHVVSIFPKVVESYCQESILKKAQEKNLVDFKFYDIRDFSENRHAKVDDKPYAGGPGMLLAAEPILKCVEFVKGEILKINKTKKPKVKIILFKPGGITFNNPTAKKYAKSYTDIILICGRYEGVDSRIEKILKPEIVSVGDFVLTGGEVPAMIVIDTVSRQVKGVLGDFDSLEESRGYRDEFYTRPEVLEWKGKKYKVPEILLSGNHKLIEEWKKIKE